ncbi:MAG: hypothetical protein ABII09_09710 [Planctomycetota bacterium]
MKINNTKSLSRIQRKASEWVIKHYSPSQGGFRFSPQAPVCLIGSCCAVLACETLDTLSSCTYQEIEVLANYIRSFQRADGWFEDPYLKPSQGNGLNSSYLRGHATFLAMMALDALGKRSDRVLEFLDASREDNRLYDWIDQLDWTNPWRASNWVEWIGYWLLAESQITVDEVPLRKECFPPGFAGLMQWLEDHQDATTGFWGNPPDKGSKRIFHQMAAAYHHYVFYYATGKPIRFKDRIIDHTIALQQPDGLFAPGGIGGGPCEDMDAIDILANMYRLADYRREEIKQALTRALAAILSNQHADGAFVYACDHSSSIPFHSLLWRLFKPWYDPGLKSRVGILRKYLLNSKRCYAGCPDLWFQTGGGDMFSQWFRPLAIATAASAIGQDCSPVWWKFGFRRQITQGWWPGATQSGKNKKLNAENK